MRDVEFVFQPDSAYATSTHKDLAHLIDESWADAPRASTIYAASAFVDSNGVLPFVKRLREHVNDGGEVKCFFGGSASQSMLSRQAAEELLNNGAQLYVLNRKKIFHAKMYGFSGGGQELIVTSGNWTGNGIGLNAESSLRMRGETLERSGFDWEEWEAALLDRFDWYAMTEAALADPDDPGWRLTFDERRRRPADLIEEDEASDEVLAFSLSKNDVNRIQDPEYPGTAYFWLSRYNAGYFPPLEVRNRPDTRLRTFSTTINVDFLDVRIKKEVTVTFEAYNNLDFRLLVGPLRATGVAAEGDIVILDRIGERDYRLKIMAEGSRDAERLRPYLVNLIGNRGKRWGMVPRKALRRL